jgi:hypothetical protein
VATRTLPADTRLTAAAPDDRFQTGVQEGIHDQLNHIVHTRLDEPTPPPQND